MATTLVLPKLGVEMDTARLVEWISSEGDRVQEGEIVANVETEKVVFELPSPADGWIHLIGEVDEEYEIGAQLAAVAETEEDYASLRHAGAPGAPPGEAEVVSASELVAPSPVTGGSVADGGIAADPVIRRDALASARRNGGPLASPLARRIAAEHGITLDSIEGSGVRGAIRRRDVERVLAAASEAVGEVVEVAESAASAPGEAPFEIVSMSPMRRTIASRMHASIQQTAQMTDIREQDVSAIVEMRRQAVDRADALGFRLSYTAIFAKAAVMALRAVPLLNASLVSESELRRYETVNLGTAVAIPDGLIVPVLRGAERLSLRELNQQLNSLIARARDRTASAGELSGGTFTVTNFGSYGSHMGTPILLPPQLGILGIGALLDRPVVRDGEVTVGKVMHTSLTVDHRVIDGEAAGAFQNELGRLFAEPDLLLYG